jgi:excisionase family DNA binding protein
VAFSELLRFGADRPIGRVTREVATMAEDKLLTPAEVARMFRVNPKTVTRWAQRGKIRAIRTLGGHRRYRQSEIERAIEAAGADDRLRVR